MLRIFIEYSYISVHQEVCQSEVFRASCSEDVILIETALFGRMRIGRCVEADLGYLGCAADVIPLLHRYFAINKF